MGLVFTEAYVYHIDFDRWTKFSNLVIKDTPRLLTSQIESADNLNLWLDGDGEVQKYPGSSLTSEETEVKTKSFVMGMGVLERIFADFTGASTDLRSIVFNKDASGGSKEDTISSPVSVTWRGIGNAFGRGRSFVIRILNAETIRRVSAQFRRIGKD